MKMLLALALAAGVALGGETVPVDARPLVTFKDVKFAKVRNQFGTWEVWCKGTATVNAAPPAPMLLSVRCYVFCLSTTAKSDPLPYERGKPIPFRFLVRATDGGPETVYHYSLYGILQQAHEE